MIARPCSNRKGEVIQAVQRVCDYIDAHLDSYMEVADLARQMNLSPHHFSMLFKRALGVPPHQYVLHKRIHEAKRHLAAGGLTLSQVALSLGFCDQSHFSRAFRKITGTTPRQYSNGRIVRRQHTNSSA